ncbi:hypothetical protein PLANPX_2023 [Lacipirellula parvula]|uniref:Uncharacterized protein n=1 Tax=Lacipirellula parvula TaxID=2650471 RepID=A0A5K7XC24_9BACT|nr:hypothetical protein PLANPX_2023 [Lacipirellula parvula]
MPSLDYTLLHEFIPNDRNGGSTEFHSRRFVVPNFLFVPFVLFVVNLPVFSRKNPPTELLFTANRSPGTIPAEFNPSAPIPHGNIRGRLVSPWAGPRIVWSWMARYKQGVLT